MFALKLVLRTRSAIDAQADSSAWNPGAWMISLTCASTSLSIAPTSSWTLCLSKRSSPGFML